MGSSSFLWPMAMSPSRWCIDSVTIEACIGTEITNRQPFHIYYFYSHPSLSSFTSIPAHTCKTSNPSPPVSTQNLFPCLLIHQQWQKMDSAVMKKYIDLSANQLTDDRIQSVSLEPQQTSHSSLKTNFCCCTCTTKVKYNYTPMRILHILFYPVGSRDICCHIGGISPGSAWFRMIRIPMQISDEMPGLQLPSQLQSVTANWPVSNYTAWWQRHTGVSGLPKATMQWCPVMTRTLTCELQVQCPTNSATISPQ